jgi:hypothetical protein
VHRLSRTLGLAAALFSLSALAAGTDGSWTRCAAPAHLTPNPGGRTFYVSTSGVDPGSCPSASNYTFRTIDAAARCALGKDTIYVRNGTYGPVTISNFYPSDWVLITNAPGENPVIDGRGPSGNGPIVADWAAIVYLLKVSKVAIQGLEIRNTGVPSNPLQGGVGIKADKSTYVRLYFNTIHDTARHAVLIDGHQYEVVGNKIYNTVMRNQNNRIATVCSDCFWDGAIATQSLQTQWGHTFTANEIHDTWGECLVIGPVDGATVEGNKIYSCIHADLYVSNSQNVTANRNWLYAANDNYNHDGERATGLLLANENATIPWHVNHVRMTNNIIEWLSRGIQYWRADKSRTNVDTYSDLYIGFNDLNRHVHSPMAFDAPGSPTTPTNKIAANLSINYLATGAWIYTEDPYFYDNWSVTPQDGNANFRYSGTTLTNPGIVDRWGSYIPAYDWRSDAQARWQIAPNSQPEMPSQDYHCSPHGQNYWNSAGAVN